MHAPDAYDALSARLVEGAGFAAVYMTGFGTAASVLGRPDIGLLTMGEMVDNARRHRRSGRGAGHRRRRRRQPDQRRPPVQEYEAAELLAWHLAYARFVKAFNTMYYEMLRTEGNRLGGDRLVLFIAGNDEEAKAVVSRLIRRDRFRAGGHGSFGGRRAQAAAGFAHLQQPDDDPIGARDVGRSTIILNRTRGKIT